LKLLVENKEITEYTLQAIIWDHISRYVGNSWLLSIEAFIPNLNYKADIVIYKITPKGIIDNRFGSMAIEVKPNGQKKELVSDIQKLKKYINRYRNPVNFGMLIYLSPRYGYEKEMQKLARKYCNYKLEVIRIYPLRKANAR